MVTATGESIPQLIDVASSLRQVRRSRQQFLTMWRIEQFSRACRQGQVALVRPELPDRDWRRLYSGSVLDD
jgi:hypothetical protein